jgi:hypothetical protein
LSLDVWVERGGAGPNSYAANLVTTVGAAVGTKKQQTTYAVIAGAVSGGGMGAFTTYAGKLYSKANAGEGLSDTDRLRRQMVVGQTTSLFSSLAGKFAEGWGDKKVQYNMENGKGLSRTQGATTGTELLMELWSNLTSPITDLFKGTKDVLSGSSPFGERSLGVRLKDGFKSVGSALGKVLVAPLAIGSAVARLVAPRQAKGAENQLRNTNPKLNIDYGNNNERGVAPAIEVPRTDMKRDNIGKDKPLPGRAMDVIKNLPGADTIKSVPNIKPSLELIPLPGLRLLPGLMSPRVGVWEEGSSTLAARLTDYLSQWTPGNKAITLVASAMGFNAYGEGRDYVVVGESDLGVGFESLSKVGALNNGVAVYEVAKGKTYFDGQRRWEAGSRFEKTANGLTLFSGVALEASFGGLSRADGKSMPVMFEASKAGVTAVGVAWDRVDEGTTFKVTEMTKVPGFGVIFGGSFDWKKGDQGYYLDFKARSLFQAEGEGMVYRQEHLGSLLDLKAEIVGDKVTVKVPSLVAADGRTMTMEGLSLVGSLTGGIVQFSSEGASTALSIKGTWGKTEIGANGQAMVRLTGSRIEVSGWVEGDFTWKVEKGNSAGDKAGGFGLGNRTLDAGHYFVRGRSGDSYYMHGKVAVSELGLHPDTEGTRFQTGTKVVYWLKGQGFNSGNVKGKDFAIASGEVMMPEGTTARQTDGSVRLKIRPTEVVWAGDEKTRESFIVEEAIIRPDGKGGYVGEVRHNGNVLENLRMEASGTTLHVRTKGGRHLFVERGSRASD